MNDAAVAQVAAGAREYGTFDFGLSSDQEKRAGHLHETSVIIDLHWQGPCSPDVWTDELLAALREQAAGGADALDFAWDFLTEKALSGEFDLYRDLYRLSGVTTGMASCALDERRLLKDAFDASRMVSRFSWARRARTEADIRAAKRAGEIAFWGMAWLNLLRPDGLDLIEVAHELGVMDVVELTYNRMNCVATGCTERADAALSNFGLDFIRRCNQVGVIVDTSHTGRRSTLNACEASTTPVIATHTSAAALYECDRAKSDEELRAIAGTGGVIGVYAVPFFLGPSGEDPATVELMLDHIDYIARLVGWQHVAIGTDWPIALPLDIQRRFLPPLLESNGFRDEHGIDVTTTLVGFRDPRDSPNITRGLVSRGYDDEQIRGILGENFLRVFTLVLG